MAVCFVVKVATPRVAKAVKAEIPCVDEPVTRLEDIGNQTQKKLLDVQAAAETCGVYDLVFSERSITTGNIPRCWHVVPVLTCKLIAPS